MDVCTACMFSHAFDVPLWYNNGHVWTVCSSTPFSWIHTGQSCLNEWNYWSCWQCKEKENSYKLNDYFSASREKERVYMRMRARTHTHTHTYMYIYSYTQTNKIVLPHLLEQYMNAQLICSSIMCTIQMYCLVITPSVTTTYILRILIYLRWRHASPLPSDSLVCKL